MDNFLGVWGAFGLGWLLIILFWIIVILGIITLIRWLAGYGKNGSRGRERERDPEKDRGKYGYAGAGMPRESRERGMDRCWCQCPCHSQFDWKNEKDPAKGTTDYLPILKERYARGEITKEQFDQMRKDLEV